MSPPSPLPQDPANPVVSSIPQRVDSDSVTTASLESFPDDWRLNPIIPKDLKRYDRTYKIDKWPKSRIKYKLEPLQSPTTPNLLSPDWEAHTQFDGRCIFYHSEKRVLTEAWLYDQQEVDKINICIHALEQLEGVYGSPPSNSQLVLEMEPDPEVPDNWRCWYYYADSQSRNIFWYHENEMGCYLTEVGGGEVGMHASMQIKAHPITSAHVQSLGQFLQREYCVQTVEEQILDEICTFFRYAHTDVRTSIDSTIPYRLPGELEHWEKQVDAARESLRKRGSGLPWIVGKLLDMDPISSIISKLNPGRAMQSMCEYRYLNYYGQRGARLRPHSVHGDGERPKRSLWFRILSSLLLRSPDAYLLDFEKFWIDETVIYSLWLEFVKRRMSDWTENTAFGTILLTVNVGFLAIPRVDNGNSPRSSAQIVSYMSIITTLAGVMLGLLLLRLHRTMERASAHEANDFLRHRSHQEYGLEKLCIMYSLPYALLMYALALSMVAILCMCLVSANTITLVLVISTSVLAFLLVSWFIKLAWNNDPKHWRQWKRPKSRFGSRLFRRRRNFTASLDIESGLQTSEPKWMEKSKTLLKRFSSASASGNSSNTSCTSSNSASTKAE
ncbi:hypothetical protein K435DRAFT_859315 [Dendrothele bispora CBS 962.96]|uniref:WW domain-containing protein n=1 Tax=Dendrothele bispora (strain CBS 962.96) TaxID=1314807 RepID=A0A4S8M1D8_DENBC|nr:hypothetical protein K435DRAFT_859315 [Dendrothele bispora CBS 962.96]